MPAPDLATTSQTQRYTWAALTAPDITRTLDLQELEAARAGLERRYPLLDARLVRQILALPLEARVPRERFKQLLRDAAGDALPPVVASRSTPTVFSASIQSNVRKAWPALIEVLDQGPWLAEPWVDRQAARDLAYQLWSRGLPVPPSQPMNTLWKIASLECWLRARRAAPLCAPANPATLPSEQAASTNPVRSRG